jgi:hypothetical protein
VLFIGIGLGETPVDSGPGPSDAEKMITRNPAVLANLAIWRFITHELAGLSHLYPEYDAKKAICPNEPKPPVSISNLLPERVLTDNRRGADPHGSAAHAL